MSFSYIFPDEILLILFNFCDVHTLFQISRVCTQFYRISSVILNERANQLLVTNQMSKRFRERCKSLLSHNTKFIMHDRWKNRMYMRRKICKINDLLSYRNRHNPDCLQMTENMIWFHSRKSLFAYNRAERGTLDKNVIVGKCNSEIRDIAYCNNEIISGHKDGSIRHWRIESRNKKKYLQQFKIHFKAHNFHVDNLDATTQHIISSSSSTLKIHKNIHDKDDDSAEEKYIDIDSYIDSTEDIERYTEDSFTESILLDPTSTKFAVSIPKKLLIFDIDKSYPVIDKSLEINYCPFQLIWEDPHTILMCSERYINKMDIRTSEIVCTWNNPEDYNVLTCFSSDNLYTIVTGTGTDYIFLWDQRQRALIQTYDMYPVETTLYPLFYLPLWWPKYSRSDMSPAFSIQFDSTYLYAITLKGLIELDFKKGTETQKIISKFSF